VVIIGIIAAIAVPRISAGALRSDESALVADLTTLRSAIDRYAAEHQGVFPGARTDGIGGATNSETALLNQLLKYSNSPGGASSSPGSAHPLGPYLRRMPPLPVGANKNMTAIAIDTLNDPPVVVVGLYGWVYNPSVGEIIANSDDANRDNSRAYDEY